MEKLLGSVLVFLFLLSPVYSQNSVKGKVCDSVQAPVAFATIALLKKSDSTLIKGTLTDESGSFSFSGIAAGEYVLKILAVGYKDQSGPAFELDSTAQIVLPSVRMLSSGHNLNEISVSAIRQTIEFKNGNIIVNVENSPLAKGNSVYDLLHKMPGVSVDDDNITLQGKTGVIFLIDGRTLQVSNQQLITLLKSMNAESVEKIEILKNPPARYDASGTSGMIDIKTKKTHLLGMNGSVYTSLSQGTYGNLMSGLSLNYKTEKLTFFSGFDYNYNATKTYEQLDRSVSSGADPTLFSEKNTRAQTSVVYNYKAGTDWNANKKNTFGFKIEGESGSSLTDGSGVNTISGLNTVGFDHLFAIQKLPDNWNLINENINAEHRFDTSGTALNFTSDYTTLSEKARSYNESHFLDIANQEALPANIFQGTNSSLTHILATKLDFRKHLNASSSFETGLKSSMVDVHNNFLFERQDNSSGQFYTDTSLSNNFVYTETTTAAYFNYLKSFKKLSGQFGLRVEDTHMQGRNVGKNFSINRDYLNVFPNISLDFEKSADHNFQLNLNRRIDRPDYSSLNPFRDYHDQYSYFQGNPFLQPDYSNTLELTHSYKKTLVNSLSYTRIDNVMLGYTQQNDTSKEMAESIKNMAYSEAYTYSCFFQKDFTSWWSMSANVVASYLTFKGDILSKTFRTNILYYNGYMTHTLIFPKKIKLEVNGFYWGPRYYGITLIQARWMLSFAVKKSFFKDKLDCSIGITDLFNTGSYHTGANFANQNWDFHTTVDSRRLVLSIHYNFGKLKLSAPEKTNNEQEKERLKHGS